MRGYLPNYKSKNALAFTKKLIEWNQYNSSFGITEKSCKNIEIIGNIYENPDLLNSKE